MWKRKKIERDPSQSGRARRWRVSWVWIEGVLLATALVLLAVFLVARIDGYRASRAALREFPTLNSVPATATGPAEGAAEGPRQPDSPFVSANKERQSAPAQAGTLIAVLRIPKIHLAVPVLEGTDALTLNRGAGRIAGTVRPGESGNIGIAAHRDGFFRRLKNVHVGDAIELASLDGTETYTVDSIRIVSPDDIKVLAPRAHPSLTLVTCYPFHFVGSAPQRYIVSASLLRDESNGAENLQPGAPAEPVNAGKTATRP